MAARSEEKQKVEMQKQQLYRSAATVLGTDGQKSISMLEVVPTNHSIDDHRLA